VGPRFLENLCTPDLIRFPKYFTHIHVYEAKLRRPLGTIITDDFSVSSNSTLVLYVSGNELRKVWNSSKTGNIHISVIMRRVRVIIVAVEKQQILHILSVPVPLDRFS